MTNVLSTPRRMLAGLAAVALAAALLVAALQAPAASSAVVRPDYPSGVKPAFMKTCVPTAKQSSGGQFNRRQAKIYCSASYNCLEKRLTLKQFGQLATAKGKVKRVRDRCTKKAAAKALNS